MRKFLSLAAIAGLAAASSTQAVPILGQSIYVNDGSDVIATFLGSDAGYDNLLFLVAPANSHGLIFEGHVTTPGTTFNLGSFAPGTELIFALDNQQGNMWYTGPGSRNSDGIAHAIVDDNFAPGQTFVGFEDLPGGGDLDFNDIQFSFSNVSGNQHVPDAGSTFAMLGFSVGAFALLRRRA